ncbi:UNVERIFIED_CONTAM: hypothetical protein FKN15_018698 [Acipenser sinensis]
MSSDRRKLVPSPSASPSGKKFREFDSSELAKMAELLSQSMEQQALLFKTENSALRADLTIQISTVQKLISKLDLVAGEQREQKKILIAHDGKLEFLERKVVSLEDRSRRLNIRIVNLEARVEKDDSIGFVKCSIPVWFPGLAQLWHVNEPNSVHINECVLH